ncbi:MAG: CotH kinase family protein [Bacteroidia bacterium]|nr:CotH kinase family protein [Bacteroidia bacterium]
MKYLFVLLLLAALGPGKALTQTFTGGGGPIATNGTVTTFTQNVSGLTPANLSAAHGLVTVCLNITHTWDADLVIRLESPDGTISMLSDQNGGDGDDYISTCFSATATIPIATGFPPFTGTYLPSGLLGNHNNGQNGNGVWKLLIEDVYPALDDGTLLNWTLDFDSNATAPFRLDSSYLPIIVIETHGQSIVDEPKVPADCGIIYNGPGQVNHFVDPFNDYDGPIGIEIRGRSSQGFDKKSYGFEIWDSLGNSLDTSLLGLPSENDWILHGPYSDKSLMRNALMMELARQSGQYASRTLHVELILNGSYEGVYVLMEKIKRNKGRVDIARLDSTDIAGDDLTGGYIFQINHNPFDGWQSNYAVYSNPSEKLVFSHVYPKHDNILPVQADYLAAYVDSFESALISPTFMNSAGVRYDHYIDMHSFAVHYILSELSKNVDAYRLSSFLYKDKTSKGGKLVAGPMWDLNLAFKNANYCNADNQFGWMYDEHCDNYNPFWWYRLRQDPLFMNELTCTWLELRATALSQSNMHSIIDSMANLLTGAEARNFTRWPSLGIYLWPNPAPIPLNYAEEVLRLKNWLTGRGAWMDNVLAGTCLVSSPAEDLTAGITLSPNPNSGHFRVQWESREAGFVQWKLCDLRGRTLAGGTSTGSPGHNTLEVKTPQLASGIYLLEMNLQGVPYSQKVVIE